VVFGSAIYKEGIVGGTKTGEEVLVAIPMVVWFEIVWAHFACRFFGTGEFKQGIQGMSRN